MGEKYKRASSHPTDLFVDNYHCILIQHTSSIIIISTDTLSISYSVKNMSPATAGPSKPRVTHSDVSDTTPSPLRPLGVSRVGPNQFSMVLTFSYITSLPTSSLSAQASPARPSRTLFPTRSAKFSSSSGIFPNLIESLESCYNLEESLH